MAATIIELNIKMDEATGIFTSRATYIDPSTSIEHTVEATGLEAALRFQQELKTQQTNN
jgi:hypothetical protein